MINELTPKSEHFSTASSTGLPLFDLAASIEARDKGKDTAAFNRKSLLDHARKVAERLARERGEISADDVAMALDAEGISIFALGSAAGSLFRGDKWQWTGRFTKSIRVHAHANLLRIWRLR